MEVFLAMVVLAVVGVLAYVALRNAQDFSDANQVIPGVSTNAPKEWAGAHTPEARLHRRLRDTMEVLRQNAALDDPSLVDVRVALEREALAVDDSLVAVASLPKPHRDAPLQQVTKAVDAIEDTVARVVMLRGPGHEGVTRRIEEIQTRLRLVVDAREELAALDPTTGSLDALRRGLEVDPDVPPARPDPEEQPPA